MQVMRVLLAALSFFASSGPVQAGTAERANPDPVAAASRPSRTSKRALTRCGWTVSAARRDRIDSTSNLREHVARIRISHDTAQVRVACVAGANLACTQQRGKACIHSNDLDSIGLLTRDMSTNMQLSSQG